MALHDLHMRLLTLEGAVEVRAIPAEFELLLHLYAHGRLTSSQLLQKSRCSIAGFGLVKKRMLDCGLIETEKCNKDKRVTYLKLAGHVRQAMQEIDKLDAGSQAEIPMALAG